MHFREWKVLYFDQNFPEVYSLGSNWQEASIGLNNGMALNRRRAIIWTNAGPIHWRIYAVIGGDELKLGHSWVIAHTVLCECAIISVNSADIC